MTEQNTKVRTPLFPTYSEVHKLLPLWQGVTQGAVRGMISAIHDQTGTPKDPVDWSNPDAWIPERLSGEPASLAKRIWEQSERTVNPRHIYGSYLFVNTFRLLQADQNDVYGLTDRGEAFLQGDTKIIRELDEAEGIPDLLAILATKPQARRADLIKEWGEFLHENSTYGTPSTIKDTLRRQLVNLVERGYVERDGNSYRITKDGIAYAAVAPSHGVDPRRTVLQAVRAYNDDKRAQLRELLSKVPPYNFEHLARDLLESMGYEDVTVTKQSGDRGVDVIATVQFRITTVTEVVQVKRYQGNLNRTVIDQLRGVLPFHNAIRGTIITTGGFSKGLVEVATFAGAAPITLINGDKLIDLLLEHEIGVHKRSLDLHEINTDYFETSEEPVDLIVPVVE
jgi:restriction system protein